LDYSCQVCVNLFLKMFNTSSLSKAFGCLLLLIHLLACSGLKKSQVAVIDKFCNSAKALSAIPPELYYRIYQLRAQAQTLQLSGMIATNETAKESIEALQLDINDKMKMLDMADSFGKAYKIMYMYSEMLQAVANPVYLEAFAKNKNEWENSFSQLVKAYNTASGIEIAEPRLNKLSGNVAAIVEAAGSVRIKMLQKRYLKAAVDNAQAPFTAICDDFIHIDIPRISNEMKTMPAFINENYKDFLNNLQAYEIKQGNNPYNYYKYYLPVYINWQLELKQLNALVHQMNICFSSLKIAFQSLGTCLETNHSNAAEPEAVTILESNCAALKLMLAHFSVARENFLKITY
jgi:hypothetical protein